MEEIKEFKVREEQWDKCPNEITNFQCSLTNAGRWDRRVPLDIMAHGNYLKGPGKWLFLIEPKGTRTAPRYEDIRNLLSGVLEAESRNDKYKQNGISRKPQLHKQIEDMERMLKEIREEYDTKLTEGELKDLVKDGSGMDGGKENGTA